MGLDGLCFDEDALRKSDAIRGADSAPGAVREGADRLVVEVFRTEGKEAEIAGGSLRNWGEFEDCDELLL